MTEKPLDRLNYFNGQRLEASDLKTEQDYHIRVRRWLNKSLYSSGIARGLEVRAVTGEPAVMVSPGLALDAQGREIILWEEQKIKISSEARPRPGNTEAEVEGLYLTIRYSEEVTAVEKDGCEAVGGTTREDHPAWGGPTRVRARAIFEQRDFLPPETSGEVMLALVELDKDCKIVQKIDASVRRYVGTGSAAKVRQYALEGEREVACIPKESFPLGMRPTSDVVVSARVYFHIRGRQPNSVTLYLRAEEFSLLHYTELGVHNHTANVLGHTDDTEMTIKDTAHFHDAKDKERGLYAFAQDIRPNQTDPSITHIHDLFARKGYAPTLLPRNYDPNNGKAGFIVAQDNELITLTGANIHIKVLGADIELPLPGPSRIPVPDVPESILDDVKGKITGGEHGHGIEGATSSGGFRYVHKHPLSASGGTGNTPTEDPTQPLKRARTGAPLGHIYDLRVAVDSNDQTSAISDQVKVSRPSAEATSWDLLGNGTSGHPLTDKGTGPIKLDFLPGVAFDEGEHVIEFSVPLGPNGVANGGKILFNLYIE